MALYELHVFVAYTIWPALRPVCAEHVCLLRMPWRFLRAGMTLFVGVCLNIEQMAKSLVESELLFLTSDGVYVLDWVVKQV